MTDDAGVITTRLLTHAGLTRTEPHVSDFCMVLNAVKRGRYCELDVDLLISSVTDVLNCIQELTRLLYADRLAVNPVDRMVSNSVVYAVGEIMRQLTSALCDLFTLENCERVRIAITEASDLIAIAWSAFMAGDVEDVMAEVCISNGFRQRAINWAIDDAKSL
jgi:hypothetical protein